MSATERRVKAGVLLWPQYTDWPALEAAGRRADELGCDSIWTWFSGQPR